VNISLDFEERNVHIFCLGRAELSPQVTERAMADTINRRFWHFVQPISGRNGAKWGGILQNFNPNLRSFDNFLYQTY
jgi:hypothetical protein